MAEALERIECGEHGEAYATYVCEHLFTHPAQEWFGDDPGEDNPWPDSWCARCQAIFEREGEWNERNEGECRIRMVCSGCYANARDASVRALEGEELERWQAFVSQCCAELDEKQERFVEAFGLDRHERWDMHEEKATLTFSNQGVPAVIATVEFVGSVSRVSDTWLWAWANFHVPESVRGRIAAVRDLGRERHFRHLTTPKWSADEHDGWHMAAVAAHVLGAIGVYRTPGENVSSFLAVMAAEKSG